jgi:hypothetical protein
LNRHKDPRCFRPLLLRLRSNKSVGQLTYGTTFRVGAPVMSWSIANEPLPI